MDKQAFEKKLLKLTTADEVKALCAEAGFDCTDEKAKQLLEKTKLSPDELEGMNGGDRDWLTDGCAATVEATSWCWSNDSCHVIDVCYNHHPANGRCPDCGGNCYYSQNGKGTYYENKCMNCGHEFPDWKLV